MKKKWTIIASLLMVFTLLFSTATVAYAKTVYYASSGMQSGYCEDAIRTPVCKFDNLPSGVMHINYVLETDRSMEIRFYKNESLTGGYDKVSISNNPSGDNKTVTLSSSGTFYVVICTKNDTATDFYYAYDLYKN